MSTGSVLISDHAFWRPGAGVALRQREILGFLAERGPVDLVYVGAEVGEFHRLAVQLTAASVGEIRCEALPPSLEPSRAARRLADLIRERAPERVVVLSPDLAWVADLVPAAVPVVLDAAGCADGVRAIEVARACDCALFDRLDGFTEAFAALGGERVAWSPPPVTVADPLPPVRGVAQRVGVSFGTAPVDEAAMRWFHDEVWRRPELAHARAAVEVVVGGDVGDGAVARACPDFRFVGPVDRPLPFFAAVDVVAAPRTGLPPPVEALGFARPLVATPGTVAPLHTIMVSACLIVDTARDFADALALLIDDTAARRRFVDAGLAVARRDLAPEVCFRPMIAARAGLRPPPRQAPREAFERRPVDEVLREALAHERAGRLAQAESMLRRIVADEPGHAAALHGLGALLLRNGLPGAALPLIESAAAASPDAPQVWSALAAARNALGRHADAEAAADRALALHPGDLAALANRSHARRGLGRVTEAVDDCTAALARHREAPELLHERGLARWALGDAGAESDLRAAVAARPGHAAWAADLARLLHARHAATAPRPCVALACGGGLPPQWETVWALPGVAAVAVDPGAEPPADSDLLVTTDAALARDWAARGRPVWLCGETEGDSPQLKVFPDRGGRGWAIAEISAHLAVWARAWRARAAATKPVAATVPEGYIPP